MRLGVVLVGLAVHVPVSLAEADPVPAPCGDPVADPIATPLHDGDLDRQRGACLRDELSSTLGAHALIDAPGFHGVLGGNFELAGRITLRDHFELGAGLRVADVTFVQTAVNKVTSTRFGPVTVGGAWADPIGDRGILAIAATAELPYSRDEMDTLHAAGGVDALTSLALSERWLLHARLGAFAALASSDGGTTQRLGLRAGVDVVRRIRRTVAWLSGVEMQAGWNHGFDTVMFRAGIQKRIARFRGSLGIGIPLTGSDQTTALVTLGVARDL